MSNALRNSTPRLWCVHCTDATVVAGSGRPHCKLLCVTVCARGCVPFCMVVRVEQVDCTNAINTAYAEGRKAHGGKGPAGLAGAELMPLFQYCLVKVCPLAALRLLWHSCLPLYRITSPSLLWCACVGVTGTVCVGCGPGGVRCGYREWLESHGLCSCHGEGCLPGGRTFTFLGI